jgi:carbonic anhydrase
MIKPGLTNVDLKQERKASLRSAVEANVRWSMKELLLLPEAQRALKERRAALVGAVYELESGKVRFLDH